MIAPRLASKIKAGILSNVISITYSKNSIEVKRNTFSGKAIENAKINTEKAIITLAPNAFGLIECQKDCQIQRIEESNTGNITVSKQEVTNGKVSLA